MQGSPYKIGLNVHRLGAAHVATLHRLGVRQVRWTLYWSEWDHDDPARAAAYRASATAQLRRARDAGLDLLVCAHGASLASALPSGTPLVTAGLGAALDGGFVDGMMDALADAPLVGCAVHCYGLPPVDALASRVARAQWDDRQAVEWASAARQAETLGVARLYGYVLDADDARGYGILRRDGTWRAAAAWVARHQRGGA